MDRYMNRKLDEWTNDMNTKWLVERGSNRQNIAERVS